MKNNLKIGVLMTLISALAYALLTAIVKSQTAHVPLPMIVFIQSLVTLVLIVPVILSKGMVTAKQVVRTKNLHLHFLRTLFSLGISYFLFLAVRYIPLVNGVLLTNTAPLIVPFLAFFFVTRKMNHQLWLPIVIGFIGVVLVLHPSRDLFQPASLLALAAGFCMASSMLLVRVTSQQDSSLTVTFYYFLFSTLVSGFVTLTHWTAIPTSALIILLGEGMLFFIVQFALANALQHAPAEIVSSLYYSNIVFAAIIDFLVWKVGLTPSVAFGILLTCLGGILCIRVQSRAAKRVTRTVENAA